MCVMFARMQTTQARQATFAFFFLNGFLMGMWIVHIPVIERRTGIGHAQLGWLLLLLGAGCLPRHAARRTAHRPAGRP